jgi:hypothetical protein
MRTTLLCGCGKPNCLKKLYRSDSIVPGRGGGAWKIVCGAADAQLASSSRIDWL